MSAPLLDWAGDALAPAGISLLSLDAETATRTKSLTLATRAENILGYGIAGYVRALKL